MTRAYAGSRIPFVRIPPGLLNLSLGTDICHIPRIARAAGLVAPSSEAPTEGRDDAIGDVTRLLRFTRRIFTLDEERSFWLARLEKNTPRDRLAIHLAGRWAVKEAVTKAYSPVRRVLFQDMVITQKSGLAPYAIVRDTKATKDMRTEREYLASAVEAWYRDPTQSSKLRDATSLPQIQFPGEICRVSISHDGEYAQAAALADLGRWLSESPGEAK